MKKRFSFENERLRSLFEKKNVRSAVGATSAPPYTEKLSPPCPAGKNKMAGHPDLMKLLHPHLKHQRSLSLSVPPPPPTPIFSSVVFNGQPAESFPALVTIKSKTFSDGNTIWNALGWSSAPWTREIFDFGNLRAPAALPDWKIPCDGGGGTYVWLDQKTFAQVCVDLGSRRRESEKDSTFQTCSLITPVPVRGFDGGLFPMRWMFNSPPRGRLLCDFKILWLFLKNNYNKQEHRISFILTH